MRVVFTHDVADRAGRFSIGFIVGIVGLMHRIKNAAMHRFEAITQIRDGARNDHAHRIVEIARLHLISDGDGRAIINVFARRYFVFVFRCFRSVVHVVCPSASRGLCRDPYIVFATIPDPTNGVQSESSPAFGSAMLWGNALILFDFKNESGIIKSRAGKDTQ